MGPQDVLSDKKEEQTDWFNVFKSPHIEGRDTMNSTNGEDGPNIQTVRP